MVNGSDVNLGLREIGDPADVIEIEVRYYDVRTCISGEAEPD